MEEGAVKCIDYDPFYVCSNLFDFVEKKNIQNIYLFSPIVERLTGICTI